MTFNMLQVFSINSIPNMSATVCFIERLAQIRDCMDRYQQRCVSLKVIQIASRNDHETK